MASKRNPSDPSGPSARKPRPPTIELEASEVAADPAPNQTQASSEASAEPPGDANTSRPDGVTWLPQDSSPWLRPGLMAVVGVILAFALLWWTGLIGSGSGANADRLAAIEAQLRELAARPAPARNDSRAIDDIAARLSKVESATSTAQSPLSDAALANRLASAENATKTFADDIGNLNRRTDDLIATVRDLKTRAEATATAVTELQAAVKAITPDTTKTEIEMLNVRIAGLEKATGTMETEIGKRATVASDRAVRLALATSSLRAAVERGEPFVAELAAARPLTGESALVGLEPFAANGVPTNATLGRELSALIPALRRSIESSSSDGGFFDRLWGNATRLVRIRPAGDTTSDDPATVITRIDLRASAADIPGALAELAKLPAAARAVAQPWIDKAQARFAAIDTSRKLAADAINALGKASP